ncbi:hypothetical protein WG66_003650 [Moniliophthora roreri]|nr:hypothetical protein WG66_003650 [Moniliophthora roreri]
MDEPQTGSTHICGQPEYTTQKTSMSTALLTLVRGEARISTPFAAISKKTATLYTNIGIQ